jgi:hypothetical protein
MNRDEFFAKLSPLDADQLRKILWTLYWRGSGPLRERIEDELEPAEKDSRKRAADKPADPEDVLSDVIEFVELARSGAYMAGDRRVSRTERSKWRVTFRRLATDAQSALHARDTGPAEAAMEQLIDLACELRSYEYFRSEDPVEAARFVVSHAVSALWQTVLDQHGSSQFAERAASQLIQWESRYGWTRGYGKVVEKETSLAAVLEAILTSPQMWAGFADAYLGALDAAARTDPAKPKRSYGVDEIAYRRKERTADLAEWHEMLLDRLAGPETTDRLDRLISHPALGGPELTFLHARLARSRGDLDVARKLVQDSLQELPGHQDFISFALEINADLPPRARELAEQRSQWEPTS